ncbi:beta-lactamase/transpeptidase-like protein [Trichoderma austrokoningii]
MSCSAETLSHLRYTVDKACLDPQKDIPGVAVVVINQDGKELFAQSAGKRGLVSKEPMTLNTVFWIASCTKMLTGLACMQLVEQGALRLDDGHYLEYLVPELQKVQVLHEDGTFEIKNKKITLRMLLTHTAGFGYTILNERLRDWSYPVGANEFSGRIEDIISQPLVFQPGEGWEYGTGIDWAGLAVEQISGLTLNAYFQKYIFEPLGIKDMTMFPSKDMQNRLAYMHTRTPDGIIRPRDHLLRLPLVVNPDNLAETRRVFNSGGAGLFATPRDYCKVLAVLLNDGTCPQTGHQLLRKETVDEMFRNQIPQYPNYSRQGIPASKPELTNAISELYSVPENPPQGWGLTFMKTNGSRTGRSADAVHWAGLPNLWWWCDRENGVAGIVCTQILPFVDSRVIKLWAEVETQVYKALFERKNE